MEDPKEMIANLNKQISELKSQVKSATLEMEMMRARMTDLRKDAQQAVQIERFVIPDADRLGEINDLVDLMDLVEHYQEGEADAGVREALDQAFVYSRSNEKNACGLSVIIPLR